MGNEEKHKGGRPPIYDSNNEDDVTKVVELCESYFIYIKGEVKEVDVPIYEETAGNEKHIVSYEKKMQTVRDAEPPTVTGLTLYLGFENKSTLYDYAKKDEFSNPIKRALTKIEQYHEIATSMGDKCTGNIFVLKNFGWKDTQYNDHTTNGKDIPVSPIIGMQIKNEQTD